MNKFFKSLLLTTLVILGAGAPQVAQAGAREIVQSISVGGIMLAGSYFVANTKTFEKVIQGVLHNKKALGLAVTMVWLTYIVYPKLLIGRNTFTKDGREESRGDRWHKGNPVKLGLEMSGLLGIKIGA